MAVKTSAASPSPARRLLLTKRGTCRMTKEGVYMYAQMARSKWIEKCLGMVTLSGSAIWWTWETEDVFRRVRDGNKYAMKVCLLTSLCFHAACVHV